MTRHELLVELAELFDTTADQLTEEASPGVISGWDSLASMGLISLLDDAGVGEITTEDAAAFETIGAVLRFAKSRGVVPG
jgi:acyl carrier protein